jgi:phosphohistidine phosphatase
VEYRDALYLAEPGKILKAVQEAADTVQSLMVVGHNPGLEQLASLLAREPVRRKERKRHDILEEKFPTAALAVLDFAVERWRDLAPGEGKLVDFVRPRDL